MPPKKKEATEVVETNAEPNIEAYELPRALVTRIAKSELSDNVKFSKETVSALVKGSTVFINYLAGTAHDVAASKQHKSVSASDVLKALELLSFGDMVPELQTELQAYRELQKGKKAASGSTRGKTKEKSGPTINIPAQRPTNGSSASSSRPASRMDIDDDEHVTTARSAMAEEDEEEEEDMQDDEDVAHDPPRPNGMTR